MRNPPLQARLDAGTWWITPEPVIGPRVARTRWANPPYELYAGTGSGSAFAAGNGLNVSAIRNAPSPTAQEPI
jgi:hypothetical protein